MTLTTTTLATTPLGKIRGEAHNGSIAFRGIRYARAPIGDLRFCPPVPVAPWSKELDATRFGPSAPQLNMTSPDMALQLPAEPTDEDCLFLNVYTPAVDTSKRPVLFWIHGGGYVVGSGRMYDGSVFTAEHDVVVVTINYRMGALGFMHVGHLDPDLPSSVNNGILDQICALEWTRDNISAFGGDPDNVMIFGESAGATSTAMLLGSPAADGLYHKAAVHSPHVDLTPVGKGHVDFTNRMIKRLGGDPDGNGMETLRSATVDELCALILPAEGEAPAPAHMGQRRDDNVTFSPAIDGVLIDAPVAASVAARGSANVPFLGGGCRHEGTLFPTALGVAGCDDEDAAIAMFADAGVDGRAALDAYETLAPGSSLHQKLVYALTDTMFRNSMVRILDAAADSGATCWSWLCTWETDLQELGATHAMELPFLWAWIDNPDTPAMKRFVGTNPPADLGGAMRSYWVNFATSGQPSADGEPDWPRYTTDTRAMLRLDAKRTIEHNFDDQIRKLWFGK